MSEFILSRVPASYVDALWGRVEPFLKRAVDVSRGRYDMESLYNEVKSANQQLWVIFRGDDDLACALTTQFMYYPLRVNLSVTFIGSDDESITPDDWIDLMEELMEWARLHECSAIESVGRRAWGRIFKKIGFEETFTTVEAEV
jgi:hypothetical protein